jgi:hypothetical protein
MKKKKVLSPKKQLEKDLLFYLEYYKKVTPNLQADFDYLIQQIIEKLKEL